METQAMAYPNPNKWILSFAGILLFAVTTALSAAESEEVTDAEVEDATEAVSWEDLALVQETIVQRYMEATIEIAEAQSIMAEALELKKEAGIMKAEVEAMRSDSTLDKKRIKGHAKLSSRTNNAIRKKLKKKDELTAEQRKQFSSGVVQYVTGIESTDDIVDEAEPFARSVKTKGVQTARDLRAKAVAAREAATEAKNGNMIQQVPNVISDWNPFNRGDKELTAKFATGVYIASAAPKLMGSHGKTLSQIIKYLQANDIDVPPNATRALASTESPGGGFGWGQRIASWAGASGLETQCLAPAGQFCLWVDSVPAGARIVLPDVRPVYQPGIVLKAGRHRVKALADGYETSEVWADLSQGSQRLSVVLTPRTAVAE